MNEGSLFYSILLFTAAGVSAATAVLLWKRRRVPSAVPLVVLSLSLCIWSLTYAFYWLASSSQARLFWLDATYFGVVATPSSFLVFTLYYTHRERWINKSTLALLSLQPLITLLLLWTDASHGLFFAGKRTADSSTILEGGPWFWIHIVYSYGMLLVCYVLLVQMYRHTQKPYRQQTGTILFGVTLPWVSNIISLANLNPWPNLDLTPIVFTLTGLILAYALFYHELFNLVPVARGKVIETMREPVFVVDNQGRIVDANPAATLLIRELDHQRVGTVIGSPMEVFFTAWSDWVSKDDTQVETRIDIGNRPRYYERLISPLVDPRGKQQGKVIVLHNITRRKQAQQHDLDVKLEKERLRLLTTFIQNASHEFKTPLTVINSTAHLMMRIDDPDKRSPKAEMIEQQVRRISRLVDMLLLVTKLESQDALIRVPVNLNAVITEVCEDLMAKGYKGPIIRCQQQANLPRVMGDAEYLSEAIKQILDNAYRFTPPEGTVVVETGLLGGCVWLDVQDTGPGIPAEDVSNVFETFWRLDEAHTTPGFGLGLSIARKIIQLHGGDISVESAIGQGSTFRITLPVNTGNDPDQT